MLCALICIVILFQIDPWTDGKDSIEDGWTRIRNPLLKYKRSYHYNKIPTVEDREKEKDEDEDEKYYGDYFDELNDDENDDGSRIVLQAIEVLDEMHSLNLFHFIYQNIANNQFNDPSIYYIMASSPSFRKAGEIASDHLLLMEARTALEQVQPSIQNLNEVIYKNVNNDDTLTRMKVSTVYNTGFLMPDSITNEGRRKNEERNSAALKKLDSYLFSHPLSVKILIKCKHFMHFDPIAAAMLIRDHSGQLARDLIGSSTATNHWYLNKNDEMVKITKYFSKYVAAKYMNKKKSKSRKERSFLRQRGRCNSKSCQRKQLKVNSGSMQVSPMMIDNYMNNYESYYEENEQTLPSYKTLQTDYNSIFHTKNGIKVNSVVNDLCWSGGRLSSLKSKSKKGKGLPYDNEYLFWIERFKQRENNIFFNDGLSIKIDSRIVYGEPSSSTIIETMLSIQDDMYNLNSLNFKKDTNKKLWKRKKKPKKKKNKFKRKKNSKDLNQVHSNYNHTPPSSLRTDYRQIRVAWFNDRAEFIGTAISPPILKNDTISNLLTEFAKNSGMALFRKHRANFLRVDEQVLNSINRMNMEFSVRFMEVRAHSIARVFAKSEPISHIPRLYDMHEYVHKMAYLRIEPYWRKSFKAIKESFYNDNLPQDHVGIEQFAYDHENQNSASLMGPRVFGEFKRFHFFTGGDTWENFWKSGSTVYDFHGQFNRATTKVKTKVIKTTVEPDGTTSSSTTVVHDKVLSQNAVHYRTSTEMSFVFNVVHYSVVEGAAYSDPFLVRVNNKDTTSRVMKKIQNVLHIPTDKIHGKLLWLIKVFSPYYG